MLTKCCSKCGVEKLLTDFFVNAKRKDGRHSHCKVCHTANVRRWEAEHPGEKNAIKRNARAKRQEHYRAKDKEWAANNPERRKEHKRKTYYADPQKYIARATQWAQENPEQAKAKHAAWRAANPERWAETARKASVAWRKRHPEAVRENETRRKRAIAASPDWGDRDKMRVVYKKAKEWGFQVDHVVPLQHPLVCGLHVWHNLQLLDQNMNLKKRNSHWPDQPGAH